MATQFSANANASATIEENATAAGTSDQQSADSSTTAGGIAFTILQASGGKILTKSYELADGELKKTAGAIFGNGTYETAYAANMEAFKVWRDACERNQAFMYGVSKLAKRGKIRPRDLLPEDFIEQEIAARIKECFDFPEGPAIVAIDYDPPANGQVLSSDELVAALFQFAPSLKSTQLLLAPSASSGIVEATSDRVLKDQGGKRIYFSIIDGRDIRRIFEIIHIRSWLAGFGRIDVSVSGAMLIRGLADLAMRNPVQPDFAAPAVLGPGLRSDRPESTLIGQGGPLDSRAAIPELTEQEVIMYSSLVDAEKKKAEPLAKAKREEWLSHRKAKLANALLHRRGKSRLDTKATARALDDAEEALISALDRSALMGAFVLERSSGEAVTVEEVLANVGLYDGQYFRDPLEPDYGSGRSLARVFQLGDNVFLYSFAHGGKRYKLERQRVEIAVHAGESAQCVNETRRFLLSQSTVFSSGEAMAQVLTNGSLMTFTESTFGQYLGDKARYYSLKKNDDGGFEKKKVDPPLKVCKTILEMGQHRGLRPLIGVVTAPTMLPDGRLVLDPGYCDATGLYLHVEKDAWGEIPLEPNRSQLQQAFETLWYPYSQFPWAGSIDRGVVLAMLFTALTRRGFKIAPGFGIDAASQSSGKTKAAQGAVALLTGNGQDGLIPFPGKVNEEEMSKTLLSAAMDGSAVLVYDNVIGRFETSALAAAMTGGSIQGRVLGVSKMSGRMPFRTLVLVTGNNMSLGPDTAQRILVARIDPMTEHPELRSFSFDPVQVTEERRAEMVVAGLTLLQGYVAAGKPILGQGCSRFAQWDRLVRQATIWIAQELGLDFEDPIKALDAHTQGSPEQEDLLTLLRGWKQLFTYRAVTTDEVLQRLEQIDASDGADPELRCMLDVVRGWGQMGRLPVQKALGRAFGNRVGRIVKGLRLVKAPAAAGGYQRWQLDAVVEQKE